MPIFGAVWPWNAVILVGLLFVLDAVLFACGLYLERRPR
jgi:hypothetical protein